MRTFPERTVAPVSGAHVPPLTEPSIIAFSPGAAGQTRPVALNSCPAICWYSIARTRNATRRRRPTLCGALDETVPSRAATLARRPPGARRGTLPAKVPFRLDRRVATGVQVVPSKRSMTTGTPILGVTRPATGSRWPISTAAAARNDATFGTPGGGWAAGAWASAAAGTAAPATRQAPASAAPRPSLIPASPRRFRRAGYQTPARPP